MQLSAHPRIHLTYCTNIHPGESWPEVREQLKIHLPELKRRISPGGPMGVGLRLSAVAAEELLGDNQLERFGGWLREENLYLFTINGFPYGSFHRQRVKEQVYAPDWRTDERLRYTRMLIRILAKLLPGGMEGGISTSPISYKPWLTRPDLREEAFSSGSRNLARIARELAEIKAEQGKILHLDIEPEPDCLIGNAAETVDFFTNYLIPVGGTFLEEEFGLPAVETEEMIREHIRVCYDTCHFSVEYEDPSEAITSLKEAGIKIGKTQISAALKVELDQPETARKQIAERLSEFDEPTYLHQVIERRKDGSYHRYRDLPDALPGIYNGEAEEWRIHFHVPIFQDRFGLIRSSRDEILTGLNALLEESDCRHYEIETYTWEVLPENLKMDVTGSIEREYRWILRQLNE